MIGKIASFVIKLASIIVVAPLAFCVALPIGLNEIRTMTLARQYMTVQHPEGTERIAMRYSSEKMSNGDNCDFTYLEARSYRPEDRQAIVAFYGRLDPMTPSLQGPRFGDWPGDTLGKIPGIYRDFTLDLEAAPDRTYYLLEAEDTFENVPPLLDWRCV